MAKVVKTFSLSPDIAKMVEDIPVRERSRIVEAALIDYFKKENVIPANFDDLNSFIRQIVKQVIDEVGIEGTVTKKVDPKVENAINNSIVSMLGIREG